jgi:hypothetical protein
VNFHLSSQSTVHDQKPFSQSPNVQQHVTQAAINLHHLGIGSGVIRRSLRIHKQLPAMHPCTIVRLVPPIPCKHADEYKSFSIKLKTDAPVTTINFAVRQRIWMLRVRLPRPRKNRPRQRILPPA